MTQRYCQDFKNKVERMKNNLNQVDTLIKEYERTGDEEIYEKINPALDEILKLHQEFQEEFQQKVRELLEKWYPKKDNLNNFLQSIKFNEKGRVEIETLSLSLEGITDSFYLPRIIERIRIFKCLVNNLSRLPELPDNLEELDCSFGSIRFLPQKLPSNLKKFRCTDNKISDIPDLPAGLQELNLRGNPLTEEAIQKIKSHPNYDPSKFVF